MGISYPKIREEEDGWSRWIQPRMSLYKMACCDCNLVHDMKFQIVDGKVQFKARRNNRATGQLRRHRK